MSCSCNPVRAGRDVMSRNLDPDCTEHGVGTTYWEGPVQEQRRRAVEMQHRAARARRVARDPSAASDSDKLRSIADRFDLDDERSGATNHEVQEFLRRLADELDAR